MPQDSTNSWKAFAKPPAGCGGIFPAKSGSDAWRSGNRLVRGQVNVVDEAKLGSPTRSPLEVFGVQNAVRRRHGEDRGPSCWPVPAAGDSFRCISSICWAHFSDGMVLPGFRKMWWIRPAADHQTVTMTLCLGASWALGSASEPLLSPATERAIAGCHIKSTCQHTSQSGWETVHCGWVE